MTSSVLVPFWGVTLTESQSQICSTLQTRQTVQAQHIFPTPSPGKRETQQQGLDKSTGFEFTSEVLHLLVGNLGQVALCLHDSGYSSVKLV